MSSLVGPDEDDPRGKPSVPAEVQDAVRTLIRWAGDDPEREGLRFWLRKIGLYGSMLRPMKRGRCACPGRAD